MASIPSHLFSSNDEPSEDEKRSVSAEITLLESALSALESTIESRRGPFRALAKYELSVYTSLLATCQAVLSSVRRLPTEILQKIFTYFGEMERSTQKWGQYRSRHLPWVVSHICRSWREVALDTPAIWARIPRITLRPRTRSARKVDFLRTLLTRSGTVPLTLDIAISKSRLQLKTVASEDPLLPLIVSHSDRIRTLLVVTNKLSDISLLSPMRSNLSSLHTLVLSIEDSAVLGTIPPIDTFSDAPNLRTVKIVGEIPAGASLLLPRSQLTSYYERPHYRNNYGSPSPISEYSKLEILQLSETRLINSEIYSGRLENLRHLTFDKEDWTQSTFLSNIELPVVENIVLMGAYDHAYRELGQMIGRSLDSFVIRPDQGHIIQRLYIHSQFNSSEGELSALLRLTPNLRYLRTPHVPFLEDLKALCQVGSSLKPDLAPKLVRLVMGGSPPFEAISDLQSGLLQSLVYSRRDDSMQGGDSFNLNLAFNTPRCLHHASLRLNGWKGDFGTQPRTPQGIMEFIDLLPPLEKRLWKCLNLGEDGPSAAKKILSSSRLEKQLEKCLHHGASLDQLIVSLDCLPSDD